MTSGNIEKSLLINKHSLLKKLNYKSTKINEVLNDLLFIVNNLEEPESKIYLNYFERIKNAVLRRRDLFQNQLFSIKFRMIFVQYYIQLIHIEGLL